MLALTWLMGGASVACGAGALGLTLYAQGPDALAAAQLFAAVGFVVGLVCGGLHQAFRGHVTPSPAALRPEAIATRVRATLASMATERQAQAPRPGSAADRRPVPAAVPSAAAANASMARPSVAARPFVRSAFGA